MSAPSASSRPLPAVIVASSQVGRGAIGARATAFALERLGFPVWLLPTFYLPFHPGHGHTTPIRPDPEAFASAVDDLIASRWLGEVGGIITGFLGAPEQAGPLARLVGAVKAASPEALYLCDPIIGDGEELYVPEVTAVAIRDRLLPLADLATPNRFELGWLTGCPVDTITAVRDAARGLGPAEVVTTSVPALMRGFTGLLYSGGAEDIVAEHRAVPVAPHGTGDLVAGVLMAARLSGMVPERMLARTAAAVCECVQAAARAGSDELPLAACQEDLVQPSVHVAVRRLAGATKRPVLRPGVL